MKKTIISILIILSVIAGSVFANGTQDESAAYGSGQGQGPRDGNGRGQGYGGGKGRNGGETAYRENFLEELTGVYKGEPGSGELSPSEAEGLILMLEEEKLARDVYLSLYEEWNIPVFSNISESEQQHMDAVRMLLDAYGVDVPAETADYSVFSNPELQDLFHELTAAGSESVEDALHVGATIEDLDIFDLQRLLETAENDEVRILYQNLMKGSRNHMRSFTAQLSRYNIEYEASYITAQYLEKILKYNRETAPISDPDYSI